MTVVRFVALYGVECWPATEEVDHRLGVIETKMLRWMGGVTRLDHVSNADIRQRFGIAQITERLRETCLRWFSHVVRARGFDPNLPGRRPKERSKQRRLDTLLADFRAAGVYPDQAFHRARCRQIVVRADLASKRDKR